MSTSKHIDILCLVVVLLAVLTGAIFALNGKTAEQTGISLDYEERLFDTSQIHTIDIVIDDWDEFLSTCTSEEYTLCSVVIDGEAFSNVGIRGKGNTSLSSVASMDSDRYSFKIEFDHYSSGTNYYGLDKLALNNLIQDNTMMKDHLTYRMMNEFGAAAPLSSYVYITVNGEDFGLYLAVEAVEDSFLTRNYGADHGELYKPDSMNMGGGRGTEKGIRLEDAPNFEDRNAVLQMPPEDLAFNDRSEQKENARGFGGMGSSETKLQYIDDDPDNYSTIFSSAKTNITKADQQRLISALKALGEGSDIENTVDIDGTLRYFVVHNFVVNGDSYTGSMIHNYYLYEKDGALTMLPWDYNLAFGSFQGSNASNAVNDPIDTPLSVTGSGDRPMADWIFASDAYTQMYHDYFAQFLEQVDMLCIIEETEALIAPYVERDPTKFCTYEEFESGLTTLKEFCRLRRESVLGQLDGTIPTTSEGQMQDSSALVDTGNLSLSDTGSMGMGGGFGGRRTSPDREKATFPSEVTPTAETKLQMPEEAPRKQDSPQNEKSGRQMDMPDMGAFSKQAQNNSNTTFLITMISMVVLLLGLGAAFLYKRR